VHYNAGDVDALTHPHESSGETGAGAAAGPAGADSAPRRTWLAAERTYLAWLRTGLGALGLALAVGRLIPALVDVSHVAFGLLGIGYGALGIFLLCMSAFRAQRVRTALAAQRPLPSDVWTLWVLTAASLVLAVFTVILIAVEL
jgi:putative membrane protein